MSVPQGGTNVTTLAHYTKILNDIDSGKIHPSLAGDVDAIRHKVKVATRFKPQAIVAVPYQVFIAIRPTKLAETPISHKDLYYYSQLRGITLCQSYIRTVFTLDQAFYDARDKHLPK